MPSVRHCGMVRNRLNWRWSSLGSLPIFIIHGFLFFFFCLRKRSAFSILFITSVNWGEWMIWWMNKISAEYSSTLATLCKELTHWKRLWCWEGLGSGGEGDDRGRDGWMASPTRWTWVWVNSGSLWWTGRPGVLQFRGSQRVGHDWATELNWTDHSTNSL